ncbi:MAG: hypothetical protein WA771_12765, partial [Chthoniobacterales bacterium]
DNGPVVVQEVAPPTVALPPPARETTVALSGGLADREVTERPTPAFTARPDDELAPARYLLAVGPDGSVRHVFEIEETTSPEINAVAVPFLYDHQFLPAATDASPTLTWGTATIHWGLDIHRQRLE